MTLRQRFLDKLSGDKDGDPLFVPDLTLWLKWHRERGTLPPGWQGFDLAQAARALGVPAWWPVRPWRMELRGVQVDTEVSPEERVLRYTAAGRTLVERWSLGPDGDWWQAEYPVKGPEDLEAALRVVEARTCVFDPSPIGAAVAAVGEDGIVALELPMHPYSDLLHTLLGWSDGLVLLMGEHRPAVLEMLAVLERKHSAVVEAIAAMPGEVVLAPDNLDGQYISPRVFRAQLAPGYQATTEALHAAGKLLIVHAGGPIRRILPLLAECGVDAVEGIAGPPQSDATLAEARAAAGPDITLWGGIPQDALVDLHDEAEFMASARAATDEAKADRRAILGVADRVSVDSVFERLQQLAREIAR